jgi:hypothetical protein
MLNCGDCTSPYTCGGDGVANLCGCTDLLGVGSPVITNSASLDTQVFYYCNGTPSAPGATKNWCPAGYTSAYNQCGPGSGSCQQNCDCTPSCGAAACGAPDGCGGVCGNGTCPAPYTCGGSGTADQCGCTDLLGTGSPVTACTPGGSNQCSKVYYYCSGTPGSAGATMNWCPAGYTSVYNQCGPGDGSCQQNCAMTSPSNCASNDCN